MNVWQWILVIELALSALAMVWRVASGSVRRYKPSDLLSVVEIAFLIWIVTARL